MRTWILRVPVAGLIILLLPHVVPAAVEDKPDDKTIAKWISQLGDDDFDKREEASKELESAGEPALDKLREAAEKHPDAEVRDRAKVIAKAIEQANWFELKSIYGGTPGYWMNRVAFTPDGKSALVAGGAVFLFDLDAGKQVFRVMELQFARRGLAVSKDGATFLTGHQNDKVVHLADVKTGKEIQAFVGHTAGVWAAALSADGALAASGGDDQTLRIWDVKTGKELRQCAGVTDSIHSLNFAPKGNQIASGQALGMVRLWDAETGKEIRTFKGHAGAVTGVVFLPDGKSLLSSSMDGTVRLWDVETGKERTQMKHDGAVYDVAVSPDGKRALSAGYDDKTVRLWDLSNGREIHVFREHGTRVLGVAFSPDGKRAASTDANCTLRLWQLAK